MNNIYKVFMAVLVLWLLASCAEIKDTGRAIGHTTRDVTKKIGHASMEAAKTVSKETKELVNDLTEDDDGKSCQSADVKKSADAKKC